MKEPDRLNPDEMSNDLHRGAKVRWLDHPEYGLAEILNIRDGHASVRYYSSPIAYVDLSVPETSLQKAMIPLQSLGFIQEDGASRYLRVLVAAEQATPQIYTVQLAGDLIPCDVAEDGLHLLAYATRPDPVEILATLTTPSPFFFETRHALLKAILQQLQLSKGLSCVLSSRIDIYSHQVEVVRRILTDPQMRYLLADEVGLGKTIEAGMVLRQIQLDYPSAKALVLVPDALVEQWKSELQEHFGLELPIQPHSRLLDPALQAHLDILVVDEAHRLIGSECYQNLQILTASCRHVLLLSATPSLNHSSELLALLELLDPKNYQASRLHEFEKKIQRRQQIGREMLALSAANTPMFIRKSTARLQQMLPEDTIVQALSQRLFTPNADPIKVKDALQAHISETYRVYRRMLRTRRHWLSEAQGGVAPRRIELRIEYEPDDAIPKRLWSLLEEWRCQATAAPKDNPCAATAIKTYFDLATSIAFFPAQLPGLLAERLADKETPQSELSVLLKLASVVAETPASAHVRRYDLLCGLIAKMLARGKSKIIVFCSSQEAGEAIRTQLKSRPLARQSSNVQCLTAETPQQTLFAAMRTFTSNEGVHILISDRTLEEGFNLHTADAVVFCDLPWDLIRIEQRIGRTDRVARRGLKFPCYLLMSLEDDDDDQIALDEAWRRVLSEEGIDIFRHPASDLQYVAPKILSIVRETAFHGGPQAVAAMLPEIRRQVDEERKAIEEQDLVDGFHIARETASSYAEGLLKADLAAPGLGKALQAYLEGNLGLIAWWQDNAVSFQRRRDPIVPVDMLVPLAPMLNKPATVHRNIAVKQPELEFLRPGHPAIDYCHWLLLNDTRGRAFVTWRQVPGQTDTRLLFRFLLYSALNLSPIKEACAAMDELAHTSLLRLAKQWFPDRADEIWLELQPDGEYAAPPAPSLALCRTPYNKLYDRNMGEQRARYVLREFGEKRWKLACEKAAHEAMRTFSSADTLALALQAAQREAAAYFTALKAQLESRRHAGVEDSSAASRAIQNVEELGSLVVKQLRSPETHIDTAGAYLLSSSPFWKEPA